ncbi:MAG TPA: hypothetical protein VKW04_12800 [Planctomycetota bacterium]|nr:hypothetical protein [Planctomycetota bacterium]
MKSLGLALVLAALSPAGAQDEKATPKIELKGCMKVEGISFKQGQSTKYTGDTYLLKLLFTDEKGDVSQPTPTLNFVVYNGQEPYKKVQRIVTREQWKADVAKINKDTVADNTIASDKKTTELWVAVVRVDQSFSLRFDLTAEIKGVGTWTWKGVEGDSNYLAAAKGPDPKK